MGPESLRPEFSLRPRRRRRLVPICKKIRNYCYRDRAIYRADSFHNIPINAAYFHLMRAQSYSTIDIDLRVRADRPWNSQPTQEGNKCGEPSDRREASTSSNRIALAAVSPASR